LVIEEWLDKLVKADKKRAIKMLSEQQGGPQSRKT